MILQTRKTADEIRALAPRARAARRRAQEWMDALQCSGRGLAQRLQITPSSLRRFLCDEPESQPHPGRPAMMLVMERIERCCSKPVYIVDLDFVEETDDELKLWFKHHCQSLTRLRNELDAARGLGAIAPYFAQALYAPPRYKPDMCTNVLLELMGFLCRDDAGLTTESTLRRAVQRVDQLEEAALAGAADGPPTFRPQRAIGYAGSARAHAGLLLDDRLLVELGTRRMLEAAAIPHKWDVDFLWANALCFVEKLLQGRYDGAERWSRKAVEVARGDRSFSLENTIQTRELPHLRTVWKALDPALLERLEQGGLQ